MDLPFFLDRAPTVDDGEVVRFTQNGGWQKIDNLLPLLYCKGSWLLREFRYWINALQEFAKRLKVSHTSWRRGSL